MEYLVYSIERRAWWLASRNGYAFTRDRAGRFTLDEAVEITRSANFFQAIDKIPCDVIVVDDFNED